MKLGDSMKVRYVGETFYDGFGLTNGRVYTCTDIDYELNGLEVIDDDDDECLYSIINPRPIDNSSIGGKWEIVEDEDGKLAEIFKLNGVQ